MGERVPVRRALGALFAAAAAVVGASSAAGAAEPVTSIPLPPVAPAAPEIDRPADRRAAAAAAAGDALVGVFGITAGSCAGDGPAKGSTFRMIQPGGRATGPFLANSDSPCGDQTYTPLAPGSDGGLSTAAFQPNPARAFDGGNGTAAAITKPQKFMGVAFAVSTNEKDPQTGAAVAKPSLSSDGGKLSGDLRAVSVAYNNQHFNQGSPKPDGGRPGLTGGPTGTYNPATGAFTLDWTSTIVGGPFNGFTGMWHLEGTFRSTSGGTASPAASPDSGPAATPTAVSSGGAAPAPGGSTAAAGSPGAPATSATHPGTGGTLPTAFGVASLLLGGLGLAVRRRVASVATSACGRGHPPGGPAGGRVRRP